MLYAYYSLYFYDCYGCFIICGLLLQKRLIHDVSYVFWLAWTSVQVHLYIRIIVCAFFFCALKFPDSFNNNNNQHDQNHCCCFRTISDVDEGTYPVRINHIELIEPINLSTHQRKLSLRLVWKPDRDWNTAVAVLMSC